MVVVGVGVLLGGGGFFVGVGGFGRDRGWREGGRSEVGGRKG